MSSILNECGHHLQKSYRIRNEETPWKIKSLNQTLEGYLTSHLNDVIDIDQCN
jgi:hypothetical protein